MRLCFGFLLAGLCAPWVAACGGHGCPSDEWCDGNRVIVCHPGDETRAQSQEVRADCSELHSTCTRLDTNHSVCLAKDTPCEGSSQCDGDTLLVCEQGYANAELTTKCSDQGDVCVTLYESSGAACAPEQ